MKHWRVLIALAGLGMLGVPAFSADYPTPAGPVNPARPGTVNYVEGAVSIDRMQIGNRNVGGMELGPGQELATGAGKAEILLTPGIFLRVDDQSTVRMISPDLTQTQVALEHGRVGVEVDQIFPQNQVQIVDNGVTTQLIKPGYYEFDANRPEAMVFEGQAEVEAGNGKWEAVKGHHELALAADGAREKSADFNAHPVNDDLYNWSRLRSQYLAEANNQIAGEYAYAPGFYPGWYWDPYMYGYTFLGLDPFYSPFGWGFYPWGGYVGFYGRGFYGGGVGFAGGGFHGGGVHGGGFGGGGRR